MRPNDITVVCGHQENDGLLCRWSITGIPGSPPGLSDAAVEEAKRRLGEHVLKDHATQGGKAPSTPEQVEKMRGRETVGYHYLLTAEEDQALDLTAQLATVLLRICGPDAPADIDELIHHLHVIQRYVGSQAAARAFPGSFRLLGRHLADS